MGVSAGPKIETGGLVFALDARNIKTFDTPPGITDHGISDWYCFLNGTATYSAIYPNTEIIEIDANGVEVGIVTTGSDPQRGTFTTTSGRRYYGTKAIHLLQTTASDEQHELAPVSFAGTYFAHYWSRNSPETYYAYAPQDDTTLEFFDNDAVGGVTGIATATYNISKGLTTSFQSTAISTWQFFKADKPIIMTAGGNGSDKTILAPATQYTYTRRNANERTINNTAPSNAGSYVTYDTSLPTAHVEIADGSGGDCTQGIGYEYLSDTYSWGDVLSDYQIVAPYADTTVTVSYWANSQWNVGEVHSLSGTQTATDNVDRDGTNGFGVDGSTISGAAANLASGANLWKWESTKPIAVIINDSASDEERLLGWMSNKFRRTSSNTTQSFVNLVDKDNRKRMKIYGTTFDSLTSSDFLTFDGVDDRIIIPHADWQNSANITITAFVYPTNLSGGKNIIGKDGNNGYRFRISATGGNVFDRGTTNALSISYSFSTNTWYHVSAIFSSSGLSFYVNGELVTSNAVAFGGNNQTEPLAIGAASHTNIFSENFQGNIAALKFYDKALTAAEIQQNFNALRRRFGI